MEKAMRGTVVLAAGFAALLAFPWPALAASVASITLVQNVVNYRVADREDWGPAAVGTPLYTGDWTRTGSRSRAEITYKDNTIVRLASSCIMQQLDPDNRTLRLVLGKIWAKVHKATTGLKIVTPAAIAATTGTEFILEVLPDQSLHVTVLEGTLLLFPPTISPAAVEQGVQKARQGGPAPTQSTEPAKRQELNETMTVGGQSGTKGTAEAQPVPVNAGQGAIARPDAPLNTAFSVDLNVVRAQESGVIGSTSIIAVPITTPAVSVTPVAAPRTTAATTSTVQLQNAANDPRSLQGSPTTGGVRVHIK